MALKITKAVDTIDVQSIVMLIYGQPGIGKTTLAFSAQNPLMLDFDKGAHRSMLRKDTVQVSNWAEVSSFTADDIADYDTIIIDTGGRCLDMIAAHIAATDPKKKRSTGELSLQGFGALKAVFTTWLKRLTLMGKDIIILAHAKEDKSKTDEIFVRPDFQGSSSGEVFKVCDLAGYFSVENGKKVLDFNPSDTHLGKNCAGFDALIVPDLAVDRGYLADIIQQAKDALNTQSKACGEAQKIIEEWSVKINQINDINAANEFMLASDDVPAEQKNIIKGIFLKRTKSLGFKYDKTAKGFV